MTTQTFPKTFRLFCPALNAYVGPIDPQTMSNPLVARSEALLLDVRDNETLKARFFSALIGSPVVPEAVES